MNKRPNMLNEFRSAKLRDQTIKGFNFQALGPTMRCVSDRCTITYASLVPYEPHFKPLPWQSDHAT